MPIVIAGAGGHAKVVCDALLAAGTNPLDLLGYVDDDPAKWGSQVLDFPVLGQLESILDNDDEAAVFLGICHGAGSVHQLRGENTVILRLRGDRNDMWFYETEVLPMAKTYLSSSAQIYEEEKKRMSNGRIYAVPVIQVTSKDILSVLFKYAKFPVGERPVTGFPDFIFSLHENARRNYLKGLIATTGCIHRENKKNYRRLYFRDREKEFLDGIADCFESSCQIKPYRNGRRVTLSHLNTMKLLDRNFFIHPYHLSKLA